MNNQTLYQETIPVFILYLTNLQKILAKSRVYAGKKTNKTSEKKLVEGKLAPDMYNLIQQVGYAYFMALETATNLTGKQPPEFSYDEKDFKELTRSLTRAVAFLQSIRPKDISRPASAKVQTFLLAKKKIALEKYVREIALPNFFFHVTTTYDILRHLGVPLKKEDYLGSR